VHVSADPGRDDALSAADQPASGEGEGEAAAAWERRRRLAEVFGDVLPETTGDERAPGRPEDESASDAWLRAQVPPHHG
jgi:hypothetical protein